MRKEYDLSVHFKKALKLRDGVWTLHAFQNCFLLRVWIKLAAFLSCLVAFRFIWEGRSKNSALLSLLSYFYIKMRFIPFLLFMMSTTNINGTPEIQLTIVWLQLHWETSLCSFSLLPSRLFFSSISIFPMFKMPRLGVIMKRGKAAGCNMIDSKNMYVMVTYYLLRLLLRNDYWTASFGKLIMLVQDGRKLKFLILFQKINFL